MSEKSVLISLGDSRLKQISEIIGNKTCNKILDLLSEKEATVSDISRELHIPINTTDYNIKKLTESGLIEKKSHFWSVKGKKMPVYKISNKKIVISPKKTKSFASLLLALGITGLLAIAIKKMMVEEKINDIPLLKTESFLIQKTGDLSHVGFFQSIASWKWFLIGAWLAILIFFVISYIDERRRTK